MSLNAALIMVFGIFFNYYTYIDKNQLAADYFVTPLTFIFFLGLFVTFVIDYLLMLSVYKIRKFYKEKKLTAELNTKAMLLHVIAFGLLAISDIPFTFLAIKLIIDPNNEIKKLYIYSEMSVTLIATIGSALLCIIFWQFGGIKEAEHAVDE